ncbi:MAG: Flp pilus assembly complex ATPase component TadA [Gammaproteobacteria bacterium]|nr:Flp pilus assembly complex ATPase component TadA [Gammaproteobacteria bacterium]
MKMVVVGTSLARVLKQGYVMLNSHHLNTAKNHIEISTLGEYLIQDGLLDAITVKVANRKAILQNIPFIQYLVKSHLLSSQAILACCVKHFDLPVFDLKNYDDNFLQNSDFKSIFYHYRVLPIKQEQTYLYIGISDPTDTTISSAITFQTGLPTRLMLVAEEELDKIFSLHVSTTIEPISSKQYSHDESIIELTDNIIQQAMDSRASDIHIEPYQSHCRIRFRCDGILSEAASFLPDLAAQIIMRLKIMANLNIAEKRLPQDGRIVWKKTSTLDIRINICPTLFGEKIVLRLLDKTKINLDLHEIGLLKKQKKLFLTKLTQPQGIIFVTGPTGSGKTITLYSALHYLNQIERNIFSLEDPVEIELHGINQVNVHPKIGLDFATALRSILRQDPDVMMIGEIRDTTTASIAIQAAHTGHLVLSTLHTNSAIETIQRLQSLGMTSHDFMDSVSLLMAQRLVRKLCQHCKQPEDQSSLFSLNFPTYRAIGCYQCQHGYHGRIGIFELIPITHSFMTLIHSREMTHLSELAKKEGWILLQEAGLQAVKQGLTSCAEIVRVLGTENSL